MTTVSDFLYFGTQYSLVIIVRADCSHDLGGDKNVIGFAYWSLGDILNKAVFSPQLGARRT